MSGVISYREHKNHAGEIFVLSQSEPGQRLRPLTIDSKHKKWPSEAKAEKKKAGSKFTGGISNQITSILHAAR
jgi:hypothetical protein